VNVAGYANVVGVLYGTQLLASANVTAPQLISNVTTGTAPLVVTSTTLVSNLNANTLQGATTAVANTASTIALRDANGNVSANFFVGNGSALTGIITSVSNVSNGTSNLNIPAVNGNVNISVGGTANVLVVTATGANIGGTANVVGNANVGNIGATTGIFTTGNITTINSGLLQNGNSNITITANANISHYVTGNATSQLTIAGTGVNVAGYANVVGNANVGNIGATTAIFTTGNITTVNSGLLQNGNSNVTITANANISHYVTGNATSQLTIAGTGVNVAGYANVVGNANIGNIGTAQVLASANVTSPQLISNISTGTAPLVVTSTTIVPNLNAAVGNVSLYSNVTAVTTGTYYPQLTSATSGNTQTAANASFSVNVANGGLTATTFVGNLVGQVANGTSNVSIPASAGNVNISVGGTANILVVTTTGANVAGTANVTGNTTVGGNLSVTGNIITPTITAPTIAAYREYTTTNNAVTTTVTCDLSTTNVFNFTLTGNTTFTFSNPAASGTTSSFTLFLHQGGSGSYTATWPASVKWPNASVPALTTTVGKTDILNFITPDGGTTYYGSLSLSNM